MAEQTPPTLRATIEAIRDDIAEALDTRVTPKGYCATCETDHANEARLNRAVLSGLLRRLAAALAQPDADDKTIKDLEQSRDFYKRRCDALQAAQRTFREPERTAVCDILANGIVAPWRAKPDAGEDSAARTLKSLAAMLGWENVPQRDTLEREIAALKARAKATPADTPLADPPNLRLFTADGLFYLYGMGASGSGPTPQAAMRDWTRHRNTEADETWPIEPADTPPPSPQPSLTREERKEILGFVESALRSANFREHEKRVNFLEALAAKCRAHVEKEQR